MKQFKKVNTQGKSLRIQLKIIIIIMHTFVYLFRLSVFISSVLFSMQVQTHKISEPHLRRKQSLLQHISQMHYGDRNFVKYSYITGIVLLI